VKTLIVTVLGMCVLSGALAQKSNTLPDSANASDNSVKFHVGHFPLGRQPLYFVDSKEIAPEELSKINADDISSFDILKDTSATNLYGERAKFGVILINLKKEKYKSRPSQNNINKKGR
jgi:TonB-dependent SusC/RagA subfamily outer membrane receptor